MTSFSIDAILRKNPTLTNGNHDVTDITIATGVDKLNPGCDEPIKNCENQTDEKIIVDEEEIDDLNDLDDSRSLSSSPMVDENEENTLLDSPVSPLSPLAERGSLPSHPLLMSGQHPAFRNFNGFSGQISPQTLHQSPHPGVGSMGLLPGSPGSLVNSAFRAPSLEMAQRQAIHLQHMQLEILARTSGVHPARYAEYQGKSGVLVVIL